MVANGAVAERKEKRDVLPGSTGQLNPEQVDLIKRTICRGATDDELALFINQCNRTGLDPFSRQIHAVKRWNSQSKREEMAIQTGIDGFRLIAERTERYVPGREPSYTTAPDGSVISATAYVKKLARGEWHEVAATAFWSEYVQTNKEGQPTRFWSRMPHLMLAKCAEALALRKAFPMELSGLYTTEEMGQADDGERPAVTIRQEKQWEQPPQAVADKPNPETNGQASPVMVLRELKSNMAKLGELRGVTANDVAEKIVGIIRGHFRTARETVDQFTPEELRYAADSVIKTLEKAKAEAEAAKNAPAVEREPGDDDLSEETPPIEKGRLPKPVVDQFLNAFHECGTTWDVIRTQALGLIGRRLTTDAHFSTLTLDEANKCVEWARAEKARKDKAKKILEGQAA